jgi:plasmid replication initiation protein
MARESRATGATPSREEFREPRRGRVAWLTAVSRLQWRDRGRIARPSPLPLPAIWIESLRWARLARQRKLAVFPVGLALFHQRVQPFLRIFQAIELVQENSHGVL